jgi:hypothetical protein
MKGVATIVDVELIETGSENAKFWVINPLSITASLKSQRTRTMESPDPTHRPTKAPARSRWAGLGPKKFNYPLDNATGLPQAAQYLAVEYDSHSPKNRSRARGIPK